MLCLHNMEKSFIFRTINIILMISKEVETFQHVHSCIIIGKKLNDKKFELYLYFVVINMLCKFHNIWLRLTCYRTETKKSAVFPFGKGHNSRTVKLTPWNFKLDLYFVVVSIVYKFHFITFGWGKLKLENGNEKFSECFHL